jgi:hypothetical protein
MAQNRKQKLSLKKRSTRRSKSLTKKNYNNLDSKKMHGGSNSNNIAPAYFGQGTRGYYPAGSDKLETCGSQHSVSQGIISADGKFAGPNLYPMLGGGCGCSGKRQFKPNKKQTGGNRGPKVKRFTPKCKQNGGNRGPNVKRFTPKCKQNGGAKPIKH